MSTSTNYTHQVGPHVFTVWPFDTGRRREEVARSVSENLHLLMTSRHGVLSEENARASNRTALNRLASTLISPDFARVQLNGTSPGQSLSSEVVSNLEDDILLPFLAWVWLINFLPETVE